MEKRRIEFIDCMRGFTMILVVYSHVCLIFDSFDSNINSIFIRFRMPLFFFISGFMLYSSKNHKEWIKKRFKNRLLNQFLPTFFTGLLYALFAQCDPIQGLFSSTKLGYWFTYVLFEIFLLYILLCIIMDKLNCKNISRLCILCLVGLVCICSNFIINHYTTIHESGWYGLFSIQHVLSFCPFLLAGVISKMYFTEFEKLINNKYFNFIVIVTFILGYLGYLPSKFQITGMCGIMIVFKIFSTHKSFFSCNTFIGKWLSYIGKNTLPVYFLHYFILKGLSIKIVAISSFLYVNWFFEFLLIFSLSIIIVLLTLVIDKALSSFELLHMLMFGPNLKKDISKSQNQ